jgi:centractin
MEGKIEYLKLPIIVDIGSGEVKAGFSGEEKPKIIFKNYFGEPKYKKVLRTFEKENQELNDQYIGDDCDKYLGLIKLRFPVKHGVFENEQDILSVFNYLYSKLGINSQEIKEHPLLLTEPLLNPYINREKIAYSLFDNLGVPALFFASQPILSLFSTSSTSGTVLESGEGVTQSCVVYEGYSIPSSYERYNYGGADVTEYLKNLLKKRGYHFYNSTEFRLVNEIKENSCFCYGNNNIKNDIGDAKKSANKNPINYYLPDGSSISVGDERLLAPEILFNPEYIGKEYLSFPDMIINSINKVDIQLKQKSYENILLSGGNTNFNGLNEQLHFELKNKLNKNMKINLNKLEKPQYCCWIGGNIISTLEVFKKMWVTKNDWNEKGSKVIHVKTI